MTMIYPGQQKEWEYLLQCKEQERIAHAFLFSGEESLSKLGLAQAFAKLLLCAQGKKNNVPCEICADCSLFQAETHPDFIFLQGGKDKVIPVEKIRALCDDLSKTSQRADYKIAIIDHAESMNLAAASALLKTLEEPPESTIIILVSSNPYILPTTIRSRCQKILFRAPLKSKEELSRGPIKIGAALDDSKLLSDLLKLRLKKELPLNLVKNYLNDDIDIKILLARLIYWQQKILKLTVANIKEKDEEDFSKLFFNFSADTHKMFNYLDKLLNLNGAFNVGIHLNKELMLEDLFLQWTEM